MKFSEKYYKGLSAEQHYINNVWFIKKLSMLKDDGILYVVNINKKFNKLGDEIE